MLVQKPQLKLLAMLKSISFELTKVLTYQIRGKEEASFTLLTHGMEVFTPFSIGTTFHLHLTPSPSNFETQPIVEHCHCGGIVILS